MSKPRGTRRRISSGSPWWAKGMFCLGALLMVLSIGTVSYATAMLDKVNNAVATDDLLGNGDDPGKEVKGPLNFLLIGSDMRKDWDTAHSDSIMILHINENLDAANIISVPRDLYVTIQDCGTLYSSPCQTKVNDAFAVGGSDAAASVRSLATTLTGLTGLRFDGAAMINFEGFTDVVKMLGSVELCLPFDMTLAHPKGTFVEKGCKDYDSKLALGIVRERYAYGPDTPGWTPEWGIGDFGRQHMQQHFIKQLMKAAKDAGYMTNPAKVGTLIEAVGDKMLLDLGGQTVTEFAFALRGIDPSRLTTLRIPSEPAEIGNTSYVVTQPGEQELAAAALYEAIRTDDLDRWINTNPAWVNRDM